MRPRLAALALPLALACDAPGAPPRPPAPRPPRASPPALREPPPPSSVWPEEVEGLEEAVARFESAEACLAELRGRTPTAVAEGVGDLGYDGFFDDVCRGLEAVREGSVEGCEALSVSTARAGCRRRLALVQARPDACPEDRVERGREPVCVAWAARDPALCRAAPPGARARCAAVLDGDPSGCRGLRAGDRARCEAQVRRYAGALGPERHPSEAPAAETVFRVEVTEEGAPPTVIERDALARGVRIEPTGCRWRVALEGPVGDAPLPTLPGTFAPTVTLALSVPIPSETPQELEVGATEAVLAVALPRHGGFTSIAGASGAVTLEAFEPRRGGALRGSLRASLRRGGVTLSIEGRFATFVRDREPAPPGCARDG